MNHADDDGGMMLLLWWRDDVGIAHSIDRAKEHAAEVNILQQCTNKVKNRRGGRNKTIDVQQQQNNNVSSPLGNGMGHTGKGWNEPAEVGGSKRVIAISSSRFPAGPLLQRQVLFFAKH